MTAASNVNNCFGGPMSKPFDRSGLLMTRGLILSWVEISSMHNDLSNRCLKQLFPFYQMRQGQNLFYRTFIAVELLLKMCSIVRKSMDFNGLNLKTMSVFTYSFGDE